MNIRERFHAVMRFEPCDRTLLWEYSPWSATLERWRKEGRFPQLDPPTRLQIREVYGVQTVVRCDYLRDVIGLDRDQFELPLNSDPIPPYEPQILDEDDRLITMRTELGVVMTQRKDGASMPQFLDFPIKSRHEFEDYKERMDPCDPRRYPDNWSQIVQEARDRDYVIQVGKWPLGVYGFTRDMVGMERLSYLFYDDPQLVHDIMNFITDFMIGFWEQALSEIDVDLVQIYEDMCYTMGPLISPAMFREFMLPCYKRLTSFVRAHGVEVIFVDTDGNLNELIPLFLEGGVTGLEPCEAKSGVDIVAIRKLYPKLQLRGGLDARVLAAGKEAIDRELESKLPFMLERGGYIPASDHGIPPDVPWENFAYFRQRIREMVEQYGHNPLSERM